MTNEENIQKVTVVPVKKTPLEQFKETPITYSLVAVNVLFFLAIHLTNALVSQDWLVGILQKQSYFISVNHEYYRLLTAIFTHEGIMHLAFNCFALIVLGKSIELIFGKTKFLIIFMVSGLFGSLFSFIFSPYASIGASGGVFGILGVHVYLFAKNRETYLKVFGKDILQLLVINVVIGFLIPNIDYWGHFGGLFGGFLAASTFGLSREVKFNKSMIVGTVVSSLIFMSSFLYFNSNINQYETLIDDNLDAIFNLRTDQLDEIQSYKDILETEKPFLPPSARGDALIETLDQYLK